MPVFSSVVTDHWLPAAPTDVTGHGTGTSALRVVVDPSLSAERSVSLMRVHGGPTVLAVTPTRAGELALSDETWVDEAVLRRRLGDAGITLNSPDHIFYLPIDLPTDQRQLPHSRIAIGDTRRLSLDDAPAFARFTTRAPASELDEAFVELEHWLVFGTFIDGDLIAAASMYPWGGTRLADLGVITLPGFRGRGVGRATVQALCSVAVELGFEPQYRCQLDNISSIALAKASGFAVFGDWEVITNVR